MDLLRCYGSSHRRPERTRTGVLLYVDLQYSNSADAIFQACLQELIAGGFGQTGSKLYAIAANHINQAVLGFTQTTTSFKKQQQLPRHISIPDILNMQGQVARCYAETCFQKFVSDNLQRPRPSDLSERDLIKEFTQHKLSLRQGFVSTGMGDLQSKLLTVDAAKKRKAATEFQSRKCQKLLQAEQPIKLVLLQI